MNRALDNAAGMMISLFLITFAFVLVVVFVVIIIVGFLVIRFLGRQVMTQLELSETVALPVRQFGAPPRSQWLSAFEFWLFQLEQLTGVEFNTTPSRIIGGTVIISLCISIGLAMGAGILYPTQIGGWMSSILAGGFVVGIVTGWRLTVPMQGLFTDRSGGGASSDNESVVLGDGDW